MHMSSRMDDDLKDELLQSLIIFDVPHIQVGRQDLVMLQLHRMSHLLHCIENLAELIMIWRSRALETRSNQK